MSTPAELGYITAEVRIFLEAVSVSGGSNDIRVRPMSPVNPERDIFVDFDVLTQSGPCEGNVMAIQDDCRENDELELELELEAVLQAQIAEAFQTELTPAAQSSNMFGVFMDEFKSALGTLPSDLLGIFVGDVDGTNYGDIFFIR